jgi:photoactive yellow protein
MHGPSGPQPDFASPDLARIVEAMTPAAIDRVPFGVIGITREGVVRIYNQSEARLSGMGDRAVLGKFFFADVAPCMNNGYFKGRIETARQAGKVDIAFTFVGDFSDRHRELFVRVQSAADGGCWIFIRRPQHDAR